MGRRRDLRLREQCVDVALHFGKDDGISRKGGRVVVVAARARRRRGLARALRAANGTRAAWRALYAGLRAAAPDADVVPLVAGACADVEACVGAIRRSGACVCRSSGS